MRKLEGGNSGKTVGIVNCVGMTQGVWPAVAGQPNFSGMSDERRKTVP